MARTCVLLTGLTALVLLAGCAGTPPPPEPDAAAERSAALAAAPRSGGWLDGSDAGLAARCHMLRTALDDTTHSWLWIELDLAPKVSVRVSGPGSLDFVLETGDLISRVPDAGLFVALDHDANAFLNSTSGPITIRAGHGSAVAGRVRILARLPRVDTSRTVVHDVRPVPSLWTLK
ncbi:hypothetical protein H8E07_01670 [bacterium]|nr:hypothetical protein [bacterium]